MEAVSPTLAKSSIIVEYNSKDRVQCDIRAMNESKAVVGYKTVLLDPGEQSGVIKQQIDVDLPYRKNPCTSPVLNPYKRSAELAY